jgi:hypothetical protein
MTRLLPRTAITGAKPHRLRAARRRRQPVHRPRQLTLRLPRSSNSSRRRAIRKSSRSRILVRHPHPYRVRRRDTATTPLHRPRLRLRMPAARHPVAAAVTVRPLPRAVPALPTRQHLRTAQVEAMRLRRHITPVPARPPCSTTQLLPLHTTLEETVVGTRVAEAATRLTHPAVIRRDIAGNRKRQTILKGRSAKTAFSLFEPTQTRREVQFTATRTCGTVPPTSCGSLHLEPRGKRLLVTFAPLAALQS